MTVEERMQQAAEERLDAAWQWIDGESDEEPTAPEPSAPFCGCPTCEVREVLDAAVPILLDAIRSGEFQL